MNTTTTTTKESTDDSATKQSPRRTKDIFGDCALVEIIHLHDCFRGALKNLEVDVSELCREITAAGAKSSSDATTINSSSTTIITNN